MREIVLRPLEYSDAAVIHDWMNDPETVRYLGGGFENGRSPEYVWEYLRMETEGDTTNERFAIADKATNEYLGECALLFPDRKVKKAEISIVLVKEARGCGLGFRALEMLIDYAFTKRGYERLYLKCAFSNKSALRLYEKLGFVREGLLKRDTLVGGLPEDTVIMALLRKDMQNFIQ